MSDASEYRPSREAIDAAKSYYVPPDGNPTDKREELRERIRRAIAAELRLGRLAVLKP